MAEFETAIEVSTDPATAFEYLVDFVNVAEWDPNVRSAQALGDGVPGVGSGYVVTTGFYGKAVEMVCEIVRLDPPSRLEIGIDGGRATGRYLITLAPSETGTLITYRLVLELRGVARLLDRGLQLALNGVGENAAIGLRKRLNATQNA